MRFKFIGPYFNMIYRSLLTVITFGLFSFSAVAAPRDLATLITPEGKPAGKWFGTMAIGGGVSLQPALALRNALVPVFMVAQGGYYRNAFDLDDLSRGGPAPTEAVIVDAFAKLRDEIATFKSQNKGAPTSVVIGLTGHGSTAGDGTFYFGIADRKSMSGEAIAKLIVGLEADETILIMQACQSGSLVARTFPKFIESLVKPMQNTVAAVPSRRFAVMVPTYEFINSPFYTWEEVLRTSFLESAQADADKNAFVSYGEWINRLRQIATRQSDWVPESYALLAAANRGVLSLPGGAIDPQFFHYGFSADIPLYLTEGGVKDYQKGQLTIPDSKNIEPTFTAETERIYRERSIAYFESIPLGRLSSRGAELVRAKLAELKSGSAVTSAPAQNPVTALWAACRAKVRSVAGWFKL